MKRILTLIILFAILATCPACETESKMEAQKKPTIETESEIFTSWYDQIVNEIPCAVHFASDLDSETLGEYVAALTEVVIAQGNRIHELELVIGDCTQSWSEWAEDAREDNLRLKRLENAMGIEDEIEMPY